jgi:predicted transglutaminase-like cysteine proteinase
MGGSRGRWRIFCAALMGLACTAGAASAETEITMNTGGLTSQPIGHYEFCKRKPDECAIQLRDNGPLVLRDAVRDKIERVKLPD